MPTGQRLDYLVVSYPEAVGVLALTEDERVVMVGQYRYAVDEYSWEIPMGTREGGESAVECAKRELQEESGYLAGRIEPLFTFHPSNAVSDQTVYLCLASELTAGTPSPEHPEPVEELIRLELVPFDVVLAQALRGEIRDAATVIAVLLLSELGMGDDTIMKIFVNAVSAKSGGSTTYIKNLIAELSALEPKHDFLFYIPSEHVRDLPGCGEHIRVIGTDVSHRPLWERFLWDQWMLPKILQRENVDVLLSSSDFGVLFSPCAQVLLVRNHIFFSSLYLRTILCAKSRRFRVEFILRRWLVIRSARASDIVAFASASMLRDFQNFAKLPDRKVVVNYFGVSLTRFKASAEDPGTAAHGRNELLRLLYVSEYGDYKNLSTLLKALLLLRQRGLSDFRLVTTVNPAQRSSSLSESVTKSLDHRLISDPTLNNHLVIVGPVPYEEVHLLYRDADLFVFPSLAESFGHPLVEAMASGLPVLASDIPVHREICEDAAFYFSPLDPEDLAKNVLLLKSQPELRKELGRLGQSQVAQQFTWHGHVTRLLELLERAGNTRGNRGVATEKRC